MKTVTSKDAVNLLNEMLEADAEALQSLVEDRCPCNEAMAEHPTIQVGERTGEPLAEKRWEVGLLGVMNGLFGIDEAGAGEIVMMKRDGEIIGFAQKNNVDEEAE